MEGSRAQARPGKGIRILRRLGEIQYRPKVGVGSGGAVGARYPLKGAESLLLIIRNLFRYVYAQIAPPGHREAADLVRVQGSLMKDRDQRKFHNVL